MNRKFPDCLFFLQCAPPVLNAFTSKFPSQQLGRKLLFSPSKTRYSAVVADLRSQLCSPRLPTAFRFREDKWPTQIVKNDFPFVRNRSNSWINFPFFAAVLTAYVEVSATRNIQPYFIQCLAFGPRIEADRLSYEELSDLNIVRHFDIMLLRYGSYDLTIVCGSPIQNLTKHFVASILFFLLMNCCACMSMNFRWLWHELPYCLKSLFSLWSPLTLHVGKIDFSDWLMKVLFSNARPVYLIFTY